MTNLSDVITGFNGRVALKACLYEVSIMPTQQTDAIKPVCKNQPPTDDWGCVYTTVVGEKSIFLMVVECIGKFYKAMHGWPVVIILSPDNWNFGQIMKSYITGDGVTIPYVKGVYHEGYAVCCKSAPLQG